MVSRSVRRRVSVFLAGIFLLSLGGEAYGWHDCPHHHPAPRSAGAPSDGTAAEADSTGADSSPLRPAGAPCTCVGSCHAAAASPLPSAGAPVPGVSGDVLRVDLRHEHTLARLRHSSYLLPFPTGPPAA